jgi:hypothetical protein
VDEMRVGAGGPGLEWSVSGASTLRWNERQAGSSVESRESGRIEVGSDGWNWITTQDVVERGSDWRTG